MQKLAESILARIKANPKLAAVIAVTLFFIAMHYNPELIAWMPEATKVKIQTAASVWLDGLGIAFLAWVSKQHNTSGTGSTLDPYVKPDNTGGTKIVPTILIFACCAGLLTGCVTGPDGETRFDPETATKVIDTGFSTWDRYNARRYPDRPVYPPGAPYPVYP